MNAAIALGQANLTSYQPVPYAQGGLNGISSLTFDGRGELLVLSDDGHISGYSPPFSTGMAKTWWLDFVTGEQSNGDSFPYSFIAYGELRLASDSSLWLYGSGNTFGVVMPSVIALAELSPVISIVGSTATGTSPFAPGQLVSIYGNQLGPPQKSGAQVNSNDVVTNSNGGTQVLFNGVAAPILYTDATQVNTAIPCSLAGQSSTQVVVTYQGAQSAPITLPLSLAAPGIFTLNSAGTGEGVIWNQDNSLNSPSNPAARGSAVGFYATGIGVTSPCVDGQIYQSSFPTATLPVTVGVGSVGAQILYAGQAPDLMTGVAQINITIPTGAPTGVVPLTLLVGGVFSPSGVTIAVK
jgi:uncharacterized protein (TIGR03437 family)